MPASPPLSVRTSTPPGSPNGQPFIDDLFEFEADISVKEQLNLLIKNHKALFKLFSDFIKERRDCVCHCNCKMGSSKSKDEGWENSGRFLKLGLKRRNSDSSNSVISGGAAGGFSNTSVGGEDFFDVSLGGQSACSLGDVTDTGEEVDNFLREALKLKSKSCSVGNFAQKLLQIVFQPEELFNRNCSGTRGKQGLDPVKLGVVKSYVLKLYPCAKSLEDAQWRKCITCIDEFLRRRKRDFKAD